MLLHPFASMTFLASWLEEGLFLPNISIPFLNPSALLPRLAYQDDENRQLTPPEHSKGEDTRHSPKKGFLCSSALGKLPAGLGWVSSTLMEFPHLPEGIPAWGWVLLFAACSHASRNPRVCRQSWSGTWLCWLQQMNLWLFGQSLGCLINPACELGQFIWEL